jgi:DNA polymerase IV
LRKIIHLDMDCFYAAVEMRERPELAGLPIAVGGGSRRGVVTTCNYEARKYGIRSAMPGFKARELCPDLIFLPIRFDLYREASAHIRRILHDVTPLVEPLSLDEAYLDVSALNRYAWDIAKEIRRRILDETHLTSSAGIAPNKMLAKIASDWRKPNGQFAITPDQVQDFMRDLPVKKVWGIGPKSADRFAAEGLHTCGDLQKFTLPEMSLRHGKWGEELYHLCRGQDDRPVEPNRIRKSISTERTYLENLTSTDACRLAMDEILDELQEDIRSKTSDRQIRKLFIKVKFDDFTRISRECLGTAPERDVFQSLLQTAYEQIRKPVRLLGAGVRFSDITEEVTEDPQTLLPI